MAQFSAGTTTQNPNQNHLATIYYQRVGLDILVPKFRMLSACEKFDHPAGQGKTGQFWRDNVPGYNTEAVVGEGVPAATPYVNGTSTLSYTAERYSDFMATSKVIDVTSITDEGARLSKAISIRAAGSVDTIVRTEIDSNVALTSTTTGSTVGIATGSTNPIINDFKKVVTLLEGANVDPFDGTRWLAIIHPYVKYDIMADTTAGGFIDALKYQSGQKVLNGEIGEAASCRFLTSTNVGDDGTAAPNKLYYSYIFGYQGVGAVNLAGMGPDGVVDPKRSNFKMDMWNPDGANGLDPTKELGTIAAYNFMFKAITLDRNRFVILKCNTAVI